MGMLSDLRDVLHSGSKTNAEMQCGAQNSGLVHGIEGEGSGT